MHYQGQLYRALNIVYQLEPLSGYGAWKFGGRFNPVGLSALYTSTTHVTAFREATQNSGRPSPTTLVSYDADFDNILDLSTPDRCAAFGCEWDHLKEDNWMAQQLSGRKSNSQLIGERVAAQGYAGLFVPSFADGAEPDEHNIVLYSWGPVLPHRLVLVDPENRMDKVRNR